MSSVHMRITIACSWVLKKQYLNKISALNQPNRIVQNKYYNGKKELSH